MATANVVRINGFNPLSEDLNAAIESFLNCRRSMNCSPSTRPIDVTPQMVREFLTDEMDTKSASTACHSYVALSAFFSFLVDEGFLENNPTAGVSKVRCRKRLIETLTDHGDFAPDTAIGIVFSSALGVSFLLLSIIPGPKTEALSLLWGSVLTVTSGSLYLLAAVAVGAILLIGLFFKEIQTVIFNRELAKSLGLPATYVFYGILILSGLTTTASLNAIGGLLVFSLIVNPAAAAYDRVMCNAVFPHFNDKGAVLSRISRMLKPDGLIVISHPTGWEAVNEIHREAGSVVTEDRAPDVGKREIYGR